MEQVQVYLDDLAGRQEIEKVLHVQTSTIGNWYERRHIIGFPEVLVRLSVPIWNLTEVVEWWFNRTPGRGWTKRPMPGYLDDEQYWENRIKERRGNGEI